MTRGARDLVVRLYAVQFVAWTTTGMLVVAFAPRLLLLDDAVVHGAKGLAAACLVAMAAIAAVATALVTRRVRPLLDALAVGATNVDPTQVVALYGVPARLVLVDLGGTVAAGLVTLSSSMRPPERDLVTQLELLVLTLTMASVAALTAYVTMRAAVARVMERVPVAASREAVDLLDTQARRMARLRRRLMLAALAPVAFVSIGASLLVHAHVRAYDAEARVEDAQALVAGVFDTVEGDPRGRKAAIEAAARQGFKVDVSRASARPGVSRDDEGLVQVVAPLADGHATVRFAASTGLDGVAWSLALAAAAAALAWALGWRLGSLFADDVALASRELESTGVAELLRGGRIHGGARFESVASLMRAVYEMGGVFRQFAGAQQRAIDARAATERMRGLFLASMSHDLKAPLNAILGFAELVSRGPLSEGQRESVTIIEQRGRELLHLVDTILDAARIEAGELTVSPEWTRVGDVVMPAVLDARELTLGMQLEITAEIQPGAPRILVDPTRLTQGLTAIILVAARFAEHGRVVVRATMPARGDKLRIDVEVSGRGISAADREKIFDAFKHADRARRHGSLGLGPSLARAIVELHGGVLEVETTEAGGTVFHVGVPSERGASRG